MADVGTLEWARRTGGRLGFLDKLTQLAQAVALQARVLPAQLRWRLGAAHSGALVDITDIPIPDSAVARRAEEYCRDVSPPYLVHHCARSYLWAQALARPCGVIPDAELLYVACMLHDLGLTDTHADGAPSVCCFAIRGAQAARDLVSTCGWNDARSDELAEAITLHVNVAVDAEHGVEALLLNASTALDVTGLRIWELHRDTVRAVVDRHPRLGMKGSIAAVWQREGAAHPEARASFLSRWLQFDARIRSAPFAE